MADSFELLVLSFISPIFSRQWSLSKFQEAMIVSVGFQGFLVGASFWGILADKYGRKRAYVFVLLSLLIVGYLQMLSFDYALCLIFRFAMGFCVGGGFTSYALFAEFLPTESRSLYLNIFQGWFGVGSMFGAGLAWLVLEYFESDDWRMLVGIGSIPTVLAFAALPWIPESVRFAGTQGRKEEVAKIFLRIAAWHRRKISGMTLIIGTNEEEETESTVWGRLKSIFEGSLRRTTLFLSFVWFSSSFLYYGIVFFTPGFYTALDVSPYMSIFVTSCGEIFFLIGGGVVSKWIGRQKTIGYAYFLCGGGMLLMLVGARVEGFPVWFLLVVSLVARGSASAAFVRFEIDWYRLLLIVFSRRFSKCIRWSSIRLTAERRDMVGVTQPRALLESRRRL